MDLERNGHFKPAEDPVLAARILKKLEDCYPGHGWKVLQDEDGGMVNIVCSTVQHPLMSNSLYAYRLYIDRFATDPDMNCVMRAGGEILERANMHRRQWDGEFPKHVEGVAQKHQPLMNENGDLILL